MWHAVHDATTRGQCYSTRQRCKITTVQFYKAKVKRILKRMQRVVLGLSRHLECSEQVPPSCDYLMFICFSLLQSCCHKPIFILVQHICACGQIYSPGQTLLPWLITEAGLHWHCCHRQYVNFISSSSCWLLHDDNTAVWTLHKYPTPTWIYPFGIPGMI